MRSSVPALLVALGPVAIAQQPDAFFADREKALNGMSFRFEVSYRRSYAALKDVAPPGEPAMVGVGQAFNAKADYTMTIATKDGITSVDGYTPVPDRKSSKVNLARFVIIDAEGWAGHARYARADDWGKTHPDVFEIVADPYPRLSMLHPAAPSSMLGPLEYLFLAHTRPGSIFASQVRWEHRKGLWVATIKNFGPPPDFRIQNSALKNHWEWTIVYDDKTLCPLKAEGRQETLPMVRVTTFERTVVNGQTIPKKVLQEFGQGNRKTPYIGRVLYEVEEIRQTSTSPLSVVPTGTLVADYRRVGATISRGMDFPPTGIVPHNYSWRGRPEDQAVSPAWLEMLRANGLVAVLSIGVIGGFILALRSRKKT